MEKDSRRSAPDVLEIHKRLLQAYGEPTWREHLDPVSELVSTILSQNTNDTNRDRAYEELRRRFPTWEEVRDAPAGDVIEAIKTAGLSMQKGPRIQEALRIITRERGELSLDFLRDLPLDEAREWLTSINGVGKKTAAIVLLFSLGVPAFPVDTHIHRVAGRLGLIGAGVNADRAHTLLEDMLPPETFYSFHLNVIRHGREVCRARRPLCDICTLQDLCGFFVVRSA